MWLPTPSFLISSYSIILSASSSQSHYRFHIILFSSAYQSFSDPSCSDANLNGLISLQSWYNADLGSSLVLVICHIGWSLCQRTSLCCYAVDLSMASLSCFLLWVGVPRCPSLSFILLLSSFFLILLCSFICLHGACFNRL